MVGNILQASQPPLAAHGACYAVATPHYTATEVAASTFRASGNGDPRQCTHIVCR